MKNLQMFLGLVATLFFGMHTTNAQNLATVLPPSHAAVDYFLKIEGVPGESADANHDKWIDVLSIDWGSHKPGGGATGQSRRRGDVILEDLRISKSMDRTSASLQLACAKGTHIPSATLLCRKSGDKQQPYLVIKMKDLYITSYQTGGSSGAAPIPSESFSLNFAKIEYEYKKQPTKNRTKNERTRYRPVRN